MKYAMLRNESLGARCLVGADAISQQFARVGSARRTRRLPHGCSRCLGQKIRQTLWQCRRSPSSCIRSQSRRPQLCILLLHRITQFAAAVQRRVPPCFSRLWLWLARHAHGASFYYTLPSRLVEAQRRRPCTRGATELAIKHGSPWARSQRAQRKAQTRAWTRWLEPPSCSAD